MLKNVRSAWRLLKVALVLAALASNASARKISVKSLDGLTQALDAAKPGDRIILADGRYTTDSQIKLSAVGTPEEPIIIAAEHVGGVELTGVAGFRLEEPAAYVVIQGFVFTHEAGEVELGEGVHHCRITRNVFELAIPERGRARYLSVLGDDNEIDHNEFRNKSTEGQMLHVQGPGRRPMAKRTWIHHNHFHDFRPSRRNNSSALHVGHSERSMTSAWTVVEHNLFERTQGENEGAICNKASDNVYRFNTLGEQSSELSLRHGKRCLVHGNFFLGGNGLRFFSHDHRIYCNAFTNCRPAITIGNGGATIPPGPLTSHERPERVHIVHNTLVNNRENVHMQGRGHRHCEQHHRRRRRGGEHWRPRGGRPVGRQHPLEQRRRPWRRPGNRLSRAPPAVGERPRDVLQAAAVESRRRGRTRPVPVRHDRRRRSALRR
jgi:poly(beta-D-mannuronate) lyase